MPLSPTACELLIAKKAFKILTWWADNNLPWDESACHQAASEGLGQTLKWLRERGCPWNAEPYEAARF